MKENPIHTHPRLKGIRATLRQHGTSAEATLWKSLQKKQLQGRKFRRQYSIRSHIVDFYCVSEGLAVELDGEVHNHPEIALQDQIKEKTLHDLGIQLLRFENRMVFDNLEGVLNYISQHFKLNSTTPPLRGTPPHSRRGSRHKSSPSLPNDATISL